MQKRQSINKVGLKDVIEVIEHEDPTNLKSPRLIAMKEKRRAIIPDQPLVYSDTAAGGGAIRPQATSGRNVQIEDESHLTLMAEKINKGLQKSLKNEIDAAGDAKPQKEARTSPRASKRKSGRHSKILTEHGEHGEEERPRKSKVFANRDSHVEKVQGNDACSPRRSKVFANVDKVDREIQPLQRRNSGLSANENLRQENDKKRRKSINRGPPPSPGRDSAGRSSQRESMKEGRDSKRRPSMSQSSSKEPVNPQRRTSKYTIEVVHTEDGNLNKPVRRSSIKYDQYVNKANPLGARPSRPSSAAPSEPSASRRPSLSRRPSGLPPVEGVIVRSSSKLDENANSNRIGRHINESPKESGKDPGAGRRGSAFISAAAVEQANFSSTGHGKRDSYKALTHSV